MAASIGGTEPEVVPKEMKYPREDKNSIEAGLLTPPLGLLVYTVKAAIHVEGDNVQVMSIFKSSTPYWMIMLVCMVAIVVFPEIATYLPDVLF